MTIHKQTHFFIRKVVKNMAYFIFICLIFDIYMEKLVIILGIYFPKRLHFFLKLFLSPILLNIIRCKNSAADDKKHAGW